MATNIDEIEEMDELYEIMRSFNISTKGLRGIEEMRVRLKEHFAALKGSSQRRVGNVSAIVYHCITC